MWLSSKNLNTYIVAPAVSCLFRLFRCDTKGKSSWISMTRCSSQGFIFVSAALLKLQGNNEWAQMSLPNLRWILKESSYSGKNVKLWQNLVGCILVNFVWIIPWSKSILTQIKDCCNVPFFSPCNYLHPHSLSHSNPSLGAFFCFGHTTAFSLFSPQPDASSFHILLFWHVPLTSTTSLP